MAKKRNTAREEQRDLENYNKFLEANEYDGSEFDWTNVKVEGVTVEGEPMDGNALEQLIKNIKLQ